MMVPHELRQKILVENHDVPIAGHMGINGTVDLIVRAVADDILQPKLRLPRLRYSLFSLS